jgi:hypothetical protein
MPTAWEQMREAYLSAKETIRAADSAVDDMARMCVGRLQKSVRSNVTLEALKKELRDFNIQTGQWKS